MPENLESYVEEFETELDETDEGFDEWEIVTIDYGNDTYALKAGREHSELEMPEHNISTEVMPYTELLGTVEHVHESSTGTTHYVVDTTQHPEDNDKATYLLNEAGREVFHG